MGATYFVGKSAQEAVKVDVYYTDPFIRPHCEIDHIRLATAEDISAMKLEVVAGGGRKKDFWDIHELADFFDLPTMIGFHKERYPYGHDEKLILRNLINFSKADGDLNPECLHGKHWEVIKMEILKWYGCPASNKNFSATDTHGHN